MYELKMLTSSELWKEIVISCILCYVFFIFVFLFVSFHMVHIMPWCSCLFEFVFVLSSK